MSTTTTKYFLRLKSPFLFILMLCGGYVTTAQSIELGLKGAVGTTWLINGNVLSGKDNQGFNFTLSYNYGLHTAFNFQHGYSLELEVLKADIKQGYGGVFNSGGTFTTGNSVTYLKGESYSAVTDISVIQIPVLFRYEHDLSGRYIEAGLGYEIISGATYSATYKNPDQSVSNDISGQLPKGNFLAIVGLGWDKKVSHESNFYINFGFRLEYGLFDLQGVDGHGQNLSGPKSVILYESPNPYYTTYHGTHSLELTFNLGVSYRIFPKSMMRKRVVDF